MRRGAIGIDRSAPGISLGVCGRGRGEHERRVLAVRAEVDAGALVRLRVALAEPRLPGVTDTVRIDRGASGITLGVCGRDRGEPERRGLEAGDLGKVLDHGSPVR